MIKPKHTPIRTCVACRSTDAKRGLMRVVRLADGAVCYDSKGKMSGRGAYVCARKECLQLARKQKKLERSLKVGAVPESVFAELEVRIGDTSMDAGVEPTSVVAETPRNLSKREVVMERDDRVPANLKRDGVEGSGREPQESEERSV